MRKYLTVQGDMWDTISLKVYGTEKFMHILIEANPKYRETVVFPANCELVIPEVPTKENVSFPSWRGNA